MLFKNPEMEIDPEAPFKSDQLERLESATILTGLVRTLEGPFVLCIDSGWGTGKTTFVKMWRHKLKKDGFHCLYFNAWENDLYPDPLVPLVGEIQMGIVATLDAKGTKAKENFEKAKKVAGYLAKRAIPVVLKLATAGLLDVGDLPEEFIATAVAEFAQERIDDYEKEKNTLKEFKEHLAEFVKELSCDDPGRPVVIFIDELDRCRPTYAVELLERVKHLFDVEGIVFVLVLDREQLAHSMRALYGAGMDVEGYLRRFIDLNYRLPDASRRRFCAHLLDRMGLKGAIQPTLSGEDPSGDLLTMFVDLAETFEFSLRVQEQCFTDLSIALRTTEEGDRLDLAALALLIALKAASSERYRRFVEGEASSDDVIAFVNEHPKGRVFLESSAGRWAEAYLASSGYDLSEMHIPITEYKDKETQADSEAQKSRYRETVRILNQISGQLHGSCRLASDLARRIDIAQRFTTTTELLIHSATWGKGEHTTDVTQVVRSQVSDGRLSLPVTNESLGGQDPIVGVRKELVVTYLYEGETHTVRTPEREYLSLP